MRRWYVVHTKPRAEAIAEANLERQGYSVYYPRLSQSVRRGQRRREMIGPLFPRYLFLNLDEGRQSLKPVHSSFGVSAVVRFGSQYAIVTDAVIDALRERADHQSGLHRLNAEGCFRPGAPVKVAEGPFEGLCGVFEREEGNERVLILLRFLGHDARVRVPTHAVAPANRAA